MEDLNSDCEYVIKTVNIKRPFYEGGRLVLVLKLTLPEIESENKLLCEGLRRFYERLSEEYVRLAEEHKLSYKKMTRPAILKVKCENMTTKEYKITIKRCAELKTDMGVRKTEYLDVFDASCGTLLKSKHKRRGEK